MFSTLRRLRRQAGRPNLQGVAESEHSVRICKAGTLARNFETSQLYSKEVAIPSFPGVGLLVAQEYNLVFRNASRFEKTHKFAM
ncbi:MAG: hypothetical protein ACLQBD_27570 [Syntrophobacteraceae bacterium]